MTVEPFKVVICGGGVAGIEGLLRLHRLAAGRVEITLLTPDTHLDYRPLAVLEPFGAQPPRRYPIARIAADTGATWVQDTLSWVDREARVVHSTAGRPLPYDALLLALGGQPRPANPHMDVFTSGRGHQMYRQILDDVDAGRLTDLAFVVPEGPSWPFPLYELAFLTSQRARDGDHDVRLHMITPAPRPLHVFGGNVSNTVRGLLAEAGITLHPNTTVEMPGEQRLILMPSRIELHPQRTVTIHRISGPDVRGIPGDATHRFLEIDMHCRVLGTDGRVFAAGDATDFPVKHGGLSAQQADTAAAGIAHLAHAGPPSTPLYPVLRGRLITGREPLYLSAHVIAGRGWSAEVNEQPPWAPDEKIIAAELGAYLPGIEAVEDFTAEGPV